MLNQAQSNDLQPRSLRFPPSVTEQTGLIAIQFEVENESYTGALLKLRLNRGKEVTVTPSGMAPCHATIARVAQTGDGEILLGITWQETGATVSAE